MTWITTAVLCVILVELLVRMPLPAIISEILLVSRKALHTLGARSISDHWKEKALLAYAGSLFISTMKLAGLLIAVAAAAILLIFTFDHSGFAMSDFLLSGAGMLFSLAAATVYIAIRKFLA